ncbi:MAG: hypothetical protein Q8R92_14695 [Deltaproteobacteria bacterium]|nr:hypothetical protein [Deltaproteobacteria bacterium]
MIDAWRRIGDLLDATLAGPHPARRYLVLALAVAIMWWLYVPLHELAHAGGCVSCGGEVRRMTLAPAYGGSIAARHFAWIDDDTPYAGQLADFTTGNSDLCYLWLVLAPYLATPLARPLFRRAGRGGAPIAFAAGAILASAPLVSIPGDFYEAASIVVTRVAASALPNVDALRSDDLPALVTRLASPGAGTTPADWALVAGAALLGALAALALTTFAIPAPDVAHRENESAGHR